MAARIRKINSPSKMGPRKEARPARMAVSMSGLAAFCIFLYGAVFIAAIRRGCFPHYLLCLGDQAFLSPAQDQPVHLPQLGLLFLVEMVLVGNAGGHEAFPGSLADFWSPVACPILGIAFTIPNRSSSWRMIRAA